MLLQDFSCVHYPITKYNLFPVWKEFHKRVDYRAVLEPKDCIVPEEVKPTKGFVLSSRRGPPVKYQIIHMIQKIAKPFTSIPVIISIV
jgi:hypothetical protein